MIDISSNVESIYNGFGSTLVTIRVPFINKNRKKHKERTGLGYCYKSDNFYKVVSPKFNDKYIDDCLLMHEYGHIYLGHLDGSHEELDERLMDVINNNHDDLVELINANCGIDYSDKLLEKVIMDKSLNHQIHNIAMDMEINSSILSYNDCQMIQDKVKDTLFSEFKNAVVDPSKVNELPPEFDKLSKLFEIKMMTPIDFGFQEGLTYPDYLVLMLMNLDKFVNLMSNVMMKMSSGNQGGSGDGDGDSITVNQGNTPSTLDEFMEMMDDMFGNGGSSQDQQGEDKSDESDGGSGDSGDGDESEDEKDGKGSGKDKNNETGDENKPDEDLDHSNPSREQSDKKRDLGDYCSKGGRGRGLNDSDAVRNYQVNKDELDMSLDEIIRECRHKVIKRDFIRDHTYKYNRRILGKGRENNILSPTYRMKVTKSEDPTIVFVIDVSGSMDDSLIDRAITTIRYKMKKINPNLLYNIIAYDTSLQQHYRNIGFNSPIPKLSSGGGTRLAGAFRLFKDEYPSDAIMVLISDFEDDLDEWNRIESTMNGYLMYGLNYGYHTNYPDFKNFKVRECRR